MEIEYSIRVLFFFNFVFAPKLRDRCMVVFRPTRVVD